MDISKATDIPRGRTCGDNPKPSPRLPAVPLVAWSYSIALVPGVAQLVTSLCVARSSGLFCFVSLYLYLYNTKLKLYAVNAPSCGYD